jgi:hypothetical protein
MLPTENGRLFTSDLAIKCVWWYIGIQTNELEGTYVLQIE